MPTIPVGCSNGRIPIIILTAKSAECDASNPCQSRLSAIFEAIFHARGVHEIWRKPQSERSWSGLESGSQSARGSFELSFRIATPIPTPTTMDFGLEYFRSRECTPSLLREDSKDSFRYGRLDRDSKLLNPIGGLCQHLKKSRYSRSKNIS
jgi:hypothetical protein